MVASLDNVRGLTLAMSSSAFIGSSFVIKKIGLKKAGDSGSRARAGSGGHSYLYEPLWWLGMVTSFIVYSCVAVVGALFLIFWAVKRSGHRKMLVYIAICSLMGSLTVISVKAVAIALKLSFSESNQFIYIQTWFFIFVVIICCLVQLNYLNKALDSFNTAVVSPIYYVMFTILTILANMIMYKALFGMDGEKTTKNCGRHRVIMVNSGIEDRGPKQGTLFGSERRPWPTRKKGATGGCFSLPLESNRSPYLSFDVLFRLPSF
ncbi:probable magnesium transporter NIPA1 isoform X7 [Hordeum vulgare subsp. vulgare]|uniref:probable magnesium transporter NIPA1 isoform X7 n=1 Tax=Hordeum vulgare subsp. vulgare TaxID=112509 RepID=UPI001D1A3D50|nr:probable magnesium transporter NIPA1 isoform X7 [Hordeum vulgare subsp. vulgare]